MNLRYLSCVLIYLGNTHQSCLITKRHVGRGMIWLCISGFHLDQINLRYTNTRWSVPHPTPKVWFVWLVRLLCTSLRCTFLFIGEYLRLKMGLILTLLMNRGLWLVSKAENSSCNVSCFRQTFSYACSTIYWKSVCRIIDQSGVQHVSRCHHGQKDSK